MNQLDNLRQFTTIVADSGELDSIHHYMPQDITTNPSLILKAARSTAYQALFEEALAYARKKGGTRDSRIANASEKLSVNIGVEMLKHIPGRVSTEVDVRFSFDRIMCVKKAHNLVALYQEQGIDKSRIFIKLASTWAGIKAAEELEKKDNINCNLTLLFSFAQARACAEAGVYLISPFVGRIYDWYNQRKPFEPYLVEEDPGIIAIRKIYDYYKQHRYKTIIMGASFRKVEQILALAGCDCLTISPVLLEELYKRNQPVERKLYPDYKSLRQQPIPLSKTEFHWEHNQDAMAVDKLAEGIRQFALDQQSLENLLATHL